MTAKTEHEEKEVAAGLPEYSTESLVPLGPVHPALKEPGYFKIYLEGERIVRVVPRIGYAHRGIEKATEARTWVQNIYLLERICGICSFAHSLTFTQAVEAQSLIEVPERAKYIRLVVAELERIHSHLLWVGLVGYWTGFDTLFMWVWRDREVVMDLIELIAGNRVNKSLAAIGGVRRDIEDHMRQKVVMRMDELADRVLYLRNLIETERTILNRTKGVGVLKPEVAERLCAVGPTIRATGLPRDIRKDDPYAAYGDIPFEVKTQKEGGVHALLRVRLDETLEAIHAVVYALDHLPAGSIRVKTPPTVPAGQNFSHIEAPRGELFHYIQSQGAKMPSRVKIRTPTLANLPSALEMLKGLTIADIPVVLTGIDPCFSCMDRISFLEMNSHKGWTWTGERLREYGIRYYETERKQ